MASQPLPTTLGTEDIGKLLRQYSLPAIVAMTAASLYNIIDSIFIGHGMGALAISGLAITFPLMNLAAAFGALVGVGASTLISVRLGQRNYESANNVLGNVLTLNLIIGISYTVLSLIFLDPMLYFFGASEATIGYARDYMQIILLGNVFSHIYFGFNAVLRSSGEPQKAMYATIATVVINSIIVPIFIFVFGWGIRGAAIGTVLSQVIAMVWQLMHFSKHDGLLHFERRNFRLRSHIVKDCLSIGLSPFLMNLASCVIVILINKGMMSHGGDLAVGAYGIVNRIAFLFLMIVMGLNQGMQPIVGYNYGAQQPERMKQALYKTMRNAVIVMIIGFIVGEAFPHILVQAFTTDEDLIARSVYGMRIVMIFFPLTGIQMVVSNFFQSIGMVRQSIFLSLTRQVLFLIPLLVILPLFFDVFGVWVSMPIADLVSFVLAIILLKRQLKKFDKMTELPTAQFD